MAELGQPDLTAMLVAWKRGDQASLDRLMELIYPELRRIARRQLGRRKPGESLESVALANEAYLKLARAGGLDCENRLHFLALCAQIMRRILVDHERRRLSAKRGGRLVGDPDADVAAVPPVQAVELLALDEALDALGRNDPRKARVVELRYFGGLTIEETAQVLGVSADVAKRDWRMAKAWLLATLSGERWE